TYPNTGLGLALRAVAGAMVRGIGTRIFYVTTGGFDTHSAQNTNAANGAYFGLMATLNDAVLAFYNDLRGQGLLEDTLLVTFSEFGRRITENGSTGTDHGAASTMIALGGRVNGGLYGTAPARSLAPGTPWLRLTARAGRLAALGRRLPALGSRLSAPGFPLSALGSGLSALGFRLRAFGSRLSAPGFRLALK